MSTLQGRLRQPCTFRLVRFNGAKCICRGKSKYFPNAAFMEASNQSMSAAQCGRFFPTLAGSLEPMGFARWSGSNRGHCCYSSEHITSGLLKWKEWNTAPPPPLAHPEMMSLPWNFLSCFWLKPCDILKKYFSINTQTNTLWAGLVSKDTCGTHCFESAHLSGGLWSLGYRESWVKLVCNPKVNINPYLWSVPLF